MMKKLIITSTLLISLTTAGLAQEKSWTLNDCMQYAVENSPLVKQKQYETDSYKADLLSSVGSVLPNIGAYSSAQYGFGRNIGDDNTYENETTFRNYYELNGKIPLFKGGYYINTWQQAKVNVSLGKSSEQVQKDDLAVKVMEAFMNVLYYKGTVHFAAEKLQESNANLYKNRRMEELGMKSYADVAQIEAQVAEDDYILTNQENLYNTALLQLKQYMNFPYDEDLQVDTLILANSYIAPAENVEWIYDFAKEHNPTAREVAYNLKSKQLEVRKMKGFLFPEIAMNVGISTNYYRRLNYQAFDNEGILIRQDGFHRQFKDKVGEYVTFSISFPIFNGFTHMTNIRKARNSARIYAEQQTETLRNLQTLIEQSVLDREGFVKEIIQMERKVNADHVAYQVMVRKFEEGLASSLDVQTNANTLLNSKATLLQKKLNYIQRDKMVNYYKGIPLVENN